MVVRTWAEVETTLRKRSGNSAALAVAELLARAQTRWDGRVLPDLWMQDLRFVAPGDIGRRVDEVRVGWEQEVFVFTLRDARGLVVAADHAKDPTADVVLDAFLMQLVGDE